MATAHEIELDRNFDYFRRHVGQFIDEQRGRIALLHNGQIDGFFDRAFDAIAAGNIRYPDQLYSIQEVTDEIVDLGYMSLALDHG